MPKIINRQDFLTALLFVAVGVLALWLGRGYVVGSASGMGPGYLPRLLSIGIIAVGVIVGVQSFAASASLGAINWRPALFISAAIGFFGLSVDRLGLVIATLGTVLIGALASKEMRLFETALLAVGLAAFCAIVFVVVLGVAMPIWPRL